MAKTVEVDSRNPKNYQFHMKIDPNQNFKPFIQKGSVEKFLVDSLENSQLGCLESKRDNRQVIKLNDRSSSKSKNISKSALRIKESQTIVT